MNRFRFRHVLCAAAVLLLAGCTTYDEPMTLKDGARGYHIYCGGFPYSGTHDCEDRAMSMCKPGTYTVLSEEDVPYAHTQALWDLSTRQIVVECNKGQ